MPFLTNDLFIYLIYYDLMIYVLRHRWEQNNWDIKEIEKICEGMDNLNETLNPNLFFGKEIGYIDHLKNWYQLFF